MSFFNTVKTALLPRSILATNDGPTETKSIRDTTAAINCSAQVL